MTIPLLIVLSLAISIGPVAEEFLPVEVEVTEVQDNHTILYEMVNRSDLPITAWALMTTTIYPRWKRVPVCR